MTLPSSGAISLSNIAGEFGGSTPHSMSEYYRGGSNVPNHGNTTNIPTSGQISFSNFYGTSNTAPIDNQISGTLGADSPPIPNKYNAQKTGAAIAGQNGINSTAGFGSFSGTNNTFTNPAGTTTFTVTSMYVSGSDILPNDFQTTIGLLGNFSGQTWNQTTGRSTITVNGVTKDLTSTYNAFGGPTTSTPVFTVTGNYSYLSATTQNNNTLFGSSGSFTATFA
jgi:hypothetical protein